MSFTMGVQQSFTGIYIIHNLDLKHIFFIFLFHESTFKKMTAVTFD